ncbi:MAG TPA: translation elongation factor Ts [Terriglobia bacterium]|jgi:elongation factor Ts|nr:translation elongation factor Ts [Terriglobia bacterium]
MVVSAEQVKKLRESTGAGMMECKTALEEAGGDLDRAVVILRKKGMAAAVKKADRLASEGIVYSYLHPGGRVGALVELNCETDFVAKTSEFSDLAKDLAMHIAAMDPKYVRREEIPEEVLNQEKEIYREKAQATGKPANVIEKIVDGQLNKFYSEVCVYDQPFVKDDNLTVGQLITEKVAQMKEHISLRRFSRFKVGEGLQKRGGDFASEVAAQLK